MLDKEYSPEWGKLLNMGEACELLNVGRQGLHTMMELKQIPFIKIGKRVKISQRDIERYIAARRTYEDRSSEIIDNVRKGWFRFQSPRMG